MEENKTESIQDCMKYYCRVCTANTKGKKCKPDDSIPIFKRTGLKSILEKYLQLQISEDDPLPKVICRACFEKVEAIEFLRGIARRTETLLKDFLKNQEAMQRPHNLFQNEYNSFAISQTTPRVKAAPEEFVVNVSLSDPLTKDINKKLLVAQRKKQSLDAKAFTHAQISRNAVTSSPAVPPVTIVHQMPRKKPSTIPNLIEKKKKLQMALTNATTVTLENSPPAPVAPPAKLPMRPKSVAPPPPPLRHISEAPAIPQKVELHPVITTNTQSLHHGVTLGSIIKDEDLLRLILKALKWPFNSQTLGIQIQRLKNTNFSDIIVDPNLLQDADLIQILGPLIHPTLLPNSTAPQQQTFHIAIPPETAAPATISYKLPAETSVQIITVPPDEKPPPRAPQSNSNLRTVIRKRPRSAMRVPKRFNTVIVVSDESEDDSLNAITANEEIQRFEVHLDPAMYPGIGDNSNSNEAMLATLNRQREAMMHRSRRKQNLLGANVEMVDDIMIVDEGVQMNEPYPDVVLVKKPRKTYIKAPVGSTLATQAMLSTAPRMEPPKKMVMSQPPPPPPPAPTPTPLTLLKLPTLPVKKLPTIPPNPIKAPLAPTATVLPAKSDAIITKKLPLAPSVIKSTTLADADSTTKILMKDLKVSNAQTILSDIEEQIIKVRIGRKAQKSPVAQVVTESERKSTSDEEVVILVEYEEDATEKESEGTNEAEKNQNKEVIVPNPDVTKESVVAASPAIQENETAQKTAELRNESNKFELPPIDIKEEEPEVDTKKELSQEIKEEKSSNPEEKAETSQSPMTAQRSFVASKTSPVNNLARLTRAGHKRIVQLKKESPKAVITTFRPARRSKTLSKYYKGPPSTSTPGRSMRSRT